MTHDSPHSADDETGASDFEDPNDLHPEITVSELKRAQAQPLAEEPVLQGEDMGKYVLVGELAKGGMAELLLAVHKGPEGFLKVVVVKRVLPHLVESPDFVRMFADEARIAARLDHPNIVRTYEFGTSEGNYFTVMEYLAGEDLGNIQRRLAISAQAMSIVGACGIIRDVCKGLQFAHDLTDTSGTPLELVHRDVNPSNLVVTYAGEVKIIDFGVAKTTNTSKTVVGTIKGKSAYMSPEHLLARGIDRRADVFSAGIVLWELLTSMSLFARDTDAATMFAIMNDPIPPPSRYRTEVPPALDAICARALARTLADRYDSMEHLQEALEDFIASQPRLDLRYVADLVESLFGTTRAEAKRAISRAQGLSRNISLVMKLRTDVRLELAARLQASLGDPPVPALASAAPVATASARSSVPYLIGGVLLVAISAALVFIATREPAAKSIAVAAPTTATLKVTSQPSGAAVFVNGEPTGYTTPVTLDQLSPGKITVRVEIAGRVAGEAVVTLSAGGAEKAFVLEQRQARLVIAGLPAGANVIVGGDSYPAGEAIVLPVGTHEVRVVAESQELLRQWIELKVGDHVWERQGERLVNK